MANLFEKFMNSMKLYDDEEEYEEDDDLDMEEEEEEMPLPRFGRRTPKVEREEEEPAYRKPVSEPAPELRAAKAEAPASSKSGRKPSVVSMRGRTAGVGPKSYEVCMIRPTKLDDAREICDTLLSGRAVVINMEGVHVDLSQRIIDFTSGACFSVQGNLQKISKYIFIVSPASIDLTGDFQDSQALAEQDLATLSLDF